MCDDEISYQEITFDEIVSRYNAGERDFSGVLVNSIYYGEEKFKGLDFSGIILRDSNLLSIRLDLGGTILHGADLSNVDLGEFYAPKIDLSNAILRGTRYWQDSTFDDANFSGSDMIGANFVSADFNCIDMSRVNLDNSKIRTTSFRGVRFIDATIRNSRLEEVTFYRCKLIRTDFRGSEFVSKIEFSECSFEETIMPDGSIRNSWRR